MLFRGSVTSDTLPNSVLTCRVTRNAFILCALEFFVANDSAADPVCRAVYGVGLQQLACWNCGFETHQGHGCLSVVSVVCFQVEVSATS